MLKAFILLLSTLCLVAGFYQEPECAAAEGWCTYDYWCENNDYVSGLCPDQPNNIKCCQGVFQEQECDYAGGWCMSESNCDGETISGLCPKQASHIKCCFSDIGGGDCTSYVTRAQWGARAPACSSWMSTPVYRQFIHHTAGSTCSSQSSCSSVMRGIQNYHMDSRGWCDIGYNWLVGGDGRIYEGRGWNTVGGHTSGYNSVSLAISFMGDFTSVNAPQNMIDAAQNWIQCAVQLNKLGSSYTLHGHRDAGSTTCPGQRLYEEIMTWPRFAGPI